MRRLVLCGLLALAACSASPPPAAAPVPPPQMTGNEPIGEKVAMAQQYCTSQANAQCGAGTIRCDAFRRAFVKNCLIRVGVPPDYVIALTMP